MWIRLLGPLELRREGGPAIPVPETKVRTLLVALLAREGAPVTVDALAEDLWGDDPPADPGRALRTNVSKLRGVLAEADPEARDRITRGPAGYLLRVGPEEVDTGSFRALVRRARTEGHPAERARLLTEALDLWRGPALAGFTDALFAQPVAAGLETERTTAVEQRAEALLETGAHLAAVDTLAALTDEHPLRESAHKLYMQALYRVGRHAEALAVFERLRLRLADELGADPGPEVAALHTRILGHAPELAGPHTPEPSRPTLKGPGLPEPVTGLIGKDTEVEEVLGRTVTERLVTLVGPGGVGKTRLALETAHRLDDDFPGGVWWVELDGLPAEDGTGEVHTGCLVEAVAAAGGLRETALGNADANVSGLAGALRGKRTLLVLDSCEHLVGTVAALVGELIAGVPSVHCLATSREPLEVSGETVHEVLPLDVPAEDGEGETEEPSSAVRLFVARARGVSPGFVLDVQSRPLVEAICRDLDGLPLALELAANRVRALGPAEIAARLHDRFGLLTRGNRGVPERQRTLQAVVDWSWDLLSEPERIVLRGLSVHWGGCTLEAAEAVCSGGPLAGHEVMEPLASLVGRSLVIAEEHEGFLRYRLLRTISAYAARRLEEAGETRMRKDRHLGYQLRLAERGDTMLRRGEERTWLRRLSAEAADQRAAFDHAEDTGQVDEALRLANATSWHRWLVGRFGTVRRELARALELPGGSDVYRAVAVTELTALEMFTGTSTKPVEAARRAVGRYAGIDDPLPRARASGFLGDHLLELDEYPAAAEHLAEADAVLTEDGDPWAFAGLRFSQARLHWEHGDLRASEEAVAESLRVYRELGSGWGRMRVAPLTHRHARARGKHEEALEEAEGALVLAEELGLSGELCFWLFTVGDCHLAGGRIDRAADLFARARTAAAEVADTPGMLHALLGQARVARLRGHPEETARFLEEWSRRAGGKVPPRIIGTMLIERGRLAEVEGEVAQASECHARALETLLSTGSPTAIASALDGAAGARALAGDGSGAALLLGAAHRARGAQGDSSGVLSNGTDRARVTETVRALAGEGFAALFHEGAELSLERVQALITERTNPGTMRA